MKAARVLVVVLSGAVGLLLAETAFRLKLWIDLAARARDSGYTVYREPLHVYDAASGYSYAPGKDVFACDVKNGVVLSGRTISVDARGNLDTRPGPPRSSTRVLIFGDSFTANPAQPLGWPHYFAGQTGYEVMNFARDGFGVVQMFRLAAEKTRELKPDFIIVAFIVEDLWRAPTWRDTAERAGGRVSLTSPKPDVAGDPEAAELALIDPEVTPEWSERVRSGLAPGDPLLKRLNGRFRDLATRHARSFLLDVRHSLILNRIRHGDPLHGVHSPSRNPHLDLMEFDGVPGFVEDVRAISVPMHLVILPRHDEIVRWKVRSSSQGMSLLKSLRSITGVDPLLLMDHMELDDVNVDPYYLLPDDQHPTPAGSEAFAVAMRRLLERDAPGQGDDAAGSGQDY